MQAKEDGFKPWAVRSAPPSGTAFTLPVASAELCEMVVISHTCTLPALRKGRGKLQILCLVSEMLLAINAGVNICEGQADYVSE